MDVVTRTLTRPMGIRSKGEDDWLNHLLVSCDASWPSIMGTSPTAPTTGKEERRARSTDSYSSWKRRRSYRRCRLRWRWPDTASPRKQSPTSCVTHEPLVAGYGSLWTKLKTSMSWR